MGLFSSKKKTVVDTSVSRVIDDKRIPETMKTSVIQAIMNDENISERVLENMQKTVAIRAERMYRYAQKNYIYGLPSGKMKSNQEGVAEVTELLESIEGSPIVVEYSQLAPANRLHVAWMRLVSQHGYNATTNVLANLTTQKGRTVYLDDVQIEIPDTEIDTLPKECLAQWGHAAVSGYSPDRAVQDPSLYQSSSIRRLNNEGPKRQQAKVLYSWFGPASFGLPTRQTGSFLIDLSDLDQDEDFLHVKYSVAGTTKFWMYEIGTGTYPVLDSLSDVPPDTAGTYFPFIFFRHGKRKFDESGFVEGYRDNKKMCRILDMDYDTLIDAIHENPDIKDVEQAVMMFAVNPRGDSQEEKRYLFDYFSEQALYQDSTVRDTSLFSGAFGLKGIFSKKSINTRHVIVIQDRLFKMTLGFDAIYTRTKAGVIGKKGTYSSAYLTRYRKVEAIDFFDQPFTSGEEYSVHVYRHQVSARYYVEVEVEGLAMEYNVSGKYSVVADEKDKILLVPVDRSITRNYPMEVREVIYLKALHFVFNSKVTYKVKWYQDSFFSFVLQVAAVVLALYSFGASAFGQSLLAYSIGMTTLQAVMITAITGLLTALAVSYGIQLFIKAVGAEFAFLAAIVAVVFGAYQMISHGSITGAPWVTELLQLANGLTNGIQSNVQAELEDVISSQSTFLKEAEEQMKLLETAKELLEPSKLLHPFTIFGEAPSDFYNRTVHSGNIGTLGISAISNYVDLSLTLPKLSETVGETFV